MKKDFLFNVFAVFAAIIAFVVLVSVFLSVNGCAPRSATMCLNSSDDWIKCPSNTPAGTILKDKR